MFLNVCGFARMIAFAKSPTVSLLPMLIGKGLLEMFRTQQKSLNWSDILDERSVKPDWSDVTLPTPGLHQHRG